MKAGVMDQVIGGQDALDTFERARRVGFAGVEVGLARAELRSPRSGRLDALRQAKRATSLETPSLVLGEHNEGGLGDADPDISGAAVEDVRRALAWAGELGADVILVPFFLRGELTGGADVDRAVAAFQELCPLAGERGVTLCYEGTLPAEEVRQMAARVGSPAFGCYFDLANPLGRGLDPATELRRLGPLVRRIHLKDARVRGGDSRPGLGRVDFSSSADAIAEVGYDGWLVLETPAGPPELAARDLSFARWAFPGLTGGPPWPRFGSFSYDFAAGEWDSLAEAFTELGLQHVILCDPLLTECLRNPDGIDDAANLLADHGLSIVGIAGYRNLVAPNAATRRDNVDFLARCLELAPAFETSVVATETGTRAADSDWTDSPENWGTEAWDLLLDAIETLLPVAERHGSILAIEAHVRNVLKTPGQLLGLLERLPSEHLQVVCDPYNYISPHLLAAEQRVTGELLRRFEHRFVAAHLKDVALEDGDVQTPELGTGVFSQRPYLDFLRSRRPDLPLILEHLPLDHVPVARRRVEELMRASS